MLDGNRYTNENIREKALLDINGCELDEVYILRNVNRRKMRSNEQYIPLMVANEMSKNIIFCLYHTDINAFRYFVCLDKIFTERKKKFTFDELCNIYSEYISAKETKEEIRKNVERLLDIFLDVGLMSAEWDKIRDCWNRVFRVRNEIAKVVGKHLKENNSFNRYFLLYNLYYPHRNFNFVSEVLKINSYLAHIGDIIDLDHPKFYINFKNPVTYKNICEILRKISNDSIYVPNIKYYHWGNTRITIYNLEKWLKDEDLQDDDCGLTQVKIRAILFISDIYESKEKDLLISSICFAPIVNMRIKEKENYKYCFKVNKNICDLFKNIDLLSDEEGRNCLYCFEFNLALQLVKKFLNEFLDKIEEKEGFEIIFDGWKFYENRFGSEQVREIINKYFDGCKYNIKTSKVDGVKPLSATNTKKEEELFEKLEKLVLSEALIKIGILEIGLCDWLCRGIFKKFKPDIIVAIARKGVIIINHLLETEVYKCFEYKVKKGELEANTEEINKLFEDFKNYIKNNNIEIMDDDEFIYKLKGDKSLLLNRILIFDDAIDEGNKISSFLEKVSEILKNEDWNKFKEKTKISAYIVNSENKGEIYEKLKQYGFNEEDCYFCLYR